MGLIAGSNDNDHYIILASLGPLSDGWVAGSNDNDHYIILASLGPLSGGWVAGSNDTNQYIQVNLEEPYRIKQIHIQGQQDEPNWVTAFKIYYRENQTTNWTLYQDDVGEYVSLHKMVIIMLMLLDYQGSSWS